MIVHRIKIYEIRRIGKNGYVIPVAKLGTGTKFLITKLLITKFLITKFLIAKFLSN